MMSKYQFQVSHTTLIVPTWPELGIGNHAEPNRTDIILESSNGRDAL